MNKLFTIIIMCAFVCPVFAIDETDIQSPLQENTAIEMPAGDNQNSYETIDKDIPLPKVEDNTFKQPVAKKQLLKKFLIAMLCVAGCSVFLYGLLSLYNRIRNSIYIEPTNPSEGEKPLDTPQDLTEAVKSFVEKNRW